jgi:hypothetical protein
MEGPSLIVEGIDCQEGLELAQSRIVLLLLPVRLCASHQLVDSLLPIRLCLCARLFLRCGGFLSLLFGYRGFRYRAGLRDRLAPTHTKGRLGLATEKG